MLVIASRNSINYTKKRFSEWSAKLKLFFVTEVTEKELVAMKTKPLLLKRSKEVKKCDIPTTPGSTAMVVTGDTSCDNPPRADDAQSDDNV